MADEYPIIRRCQYEEASLARDLETRDLETELLSSISKLITLNINMKHQIND